MSQEHVQKSSPKGLSNSARNVITFGGLNVLLGTCVLLYVARI